MAEPRVVTLMIYVILGWTVVSQMEANMRFATFKTIKVAGPTNYVDLRQQQRIIVDQQQQHQQQHQIFVDQQQQQQRFAAVDQQQQDIEQQQTDRQPTAATVESDVAVRQQRLESQLKQTTRRVRHEASSVRVLYQIGVSLRVFLYYFWLNIHPP